MQSLLIPALLTACLLAGCSGGGGGGADDGKALGTPDEVKATDTTGGIRGIVVDQAIRPIAEAAVRITGAGADEAVTTDEGGTFVVSGLEPGTYFIEATHPLYDRQQTTTEVVAGLSDPEPVKLQLTQLITADPYMYTVKFEGFLVCSINLVVLLSEECGEGVGVPCAVPVVGCQRVGGQDNNNAQFDFTVDSPDSLQTLVVEQVWEPASEAGKALYTPVSTEWSCLPSCQGNTFLTLQGESPLYGRADREAFSSAINNETTMVSTFTWASPETTGATLNQDFQIFVSQFYYLPAPEGWSFVNGDPEPF